MAQERTINDLIVLALYQINAFAVGEDIDDFAQQTGLECINLLIDSWSESQIFIPFSDKLDFVMDVGKDIYTVSNIIVDADVNSNLINEITFSSYAMGDQNQLIYPIRVIDDASYFNQLRINTLQATPAYVFLQNFTYYSELTFYPKPALKYPISMQVKSYLNSVELFTPIGSLPRAFHEFFRLHLARCFIDFYPSAEWTEKMEKDYTELLDRISAQELNMTIEPSQIMKKDVPWIYPTILSMP